MQLFNKTFYMHISFKILVKNIYFGITLSYAGMIQKIMLTVEYNCTLKSFICDNCILFHTHIYINAYFLF